MKYKIINYKLDNENFLSQHKESRTNRQFSDNNEFFKLLSKGMEDYAEYSHLKPIYEFESSSYSKAIQKFSNFLLVEYDIFNYEEYKKDKDLDREYQCYETLIDFHNEIKTIHSFKRTSNRIIYFLKDNNKVVYVGQSNNFKRPFDHIDKKWDSFDFLEIPEKYNLYLIEQLFIIKFKPKYNIGTPYSRKTMESAFNGFCAYLEHVEEDFFKNYRQI